MQNLAFVSVTGLRETLKVTLQPEMTRTALLDAVRGHLSEHSDPILFLDDADEPIDDEELPFAKGPGVPVFHCDTCRKILVAARYAGRTVSFSISPAAKIRRVLLRAAKELEIPDTDTARLKLVLAATGAAPRPDVSLGTVAIGPDCDIIFDVVSEPNING